MTAAPDRATARTASKISVSALIATVVRVALGLLWVHEGYVKYDAGFGSADIGLVVDSTASNSRVPHFYQLFTADVLGSAPGLFGVVVPLIEVGLGIALILGVLTLPLALASIAQLCTYWLADQLIAEYPIMLMLSALVLAFGAASTTYSATSWLIRRRGLTPPDAIRRWL